MPYIEVEKKVKIFVEDINPKGTPTVLFLHGWPLNRNMFEYQFDQLPKCGFRVIGMDLRGYGKSDRPWDGYDYDRLAEDVYCVIKALNLCDISLVGFSAGGAIAVRYMARFSGYCVAKLALISAALPVFTQRPDYPYSLPIEEVDKLIHQTYTDRPWMISEFSRKFFARRMSPQFLHWFESLCLKASGHATASLAISLRNEDLRKDIEQIHVPTTLFHGVYDQIVPFPNAEITCRQIKDAALIPFEFSGHGLILDELEKFNDCLIRFLFEQ
jgi:non-heme chloroperoxidase